jgi:hypothetical protein
MEKVFSSKNRILESMARCVTILFMNTIQENIAVLKQKLLRLQDYL